MIRLRKSMLSVWSSSKYSYADYPDISLSCQFSVVVHFFFHSGLHVSISWRQCRQHEYIELLRHQINFYAFFPRPTSRIKLRFYPLWTSTKEGFSFSISWYAFQTSVVSFYYMIIKELQHITKTQISLSFLSLLMSFGSWQLHHIPNQYFPSQFSLLIRSSHPFWNVRCAFTCFASNCMTSSKTFPLMIHEWICWFSNAQLLYTKHLMFARSPYDLSGLWPSRIGKFFQCRPECFHFVYVNQSFFFFWSINSCFDGSDKSCIDWKISVVIRCSTPKLIPSQESSSEKYRLRCDLADDPF